VLVTIAAANLSCLILFCDVIERSHSVSCQKTAQMKLQDWYTSMVLA